jgi:ornithine cyclodeaminase/alanine dehydrogenase-like protein (mu-crystallin family)
VPLYLSEADVESLLDAEAMLPVVEGSFRRLADGEVELLPRRRLRLAGGALALMAAVDRGLGYAGEKSYVTVGGRAAFVVCLFDGERGTLEAVVEADRLGRLRTGAASGVAAARLARAGAASVGLIGCGRQAETQLAAIRAALPGIARAVAWCRTPERLRAFCELTGAEPAEGPHEAGAQDVVVTITTSRDPVLRGDWLREGALVCAAGANRPEARELDNLVLERASFVCCDSLEQARLESGDLIEPVAAGVLDWLEVHELQEVVAGEVAGRAGERDVVVFKSNGIAAWDVAAAAEALRLARERGVGRELP